MGCKLLLCHTTIQSSVNDKYLVYITDVITRLLEAHAFKEKVGVFAGEFFPCDGVAGSAVISGEGCIEVTV